MGVNLCKPVSIYLCLLDSIEKRHVFFTHTHTHRLLILCTSWWCLRIQGYETGNDWPAVIHILGQVPGTLLPMVPTYHSGLIFCSDSLFTTPNLSTSPFLPSLCLCTCCSFYLQCPSLSGPPGKLLILWEAEQGFPLKSWIWALPHCRSLLCVSFVSYVATGVR